MAGKVQDTGKIISDGADRVTRTQFCDNCAYKLDLVMYDFTDGGCMEREMPGFVCAQNTDGVAKWMLGFPKKDVCCTHWRRKDDGE